MPFRSRQRSNSNINSSSDCIQRRQMLKRHGKSKFSEGEVVLCYEPDPAKTKVLYSSKVIQIVEKYDDNDRRYEEYLIHFHGWNSTWDRYVTEDYILKDTPENRKLQQELANEAQLTPGGNLYKRDLRNRRRSSSSRRKLKSSESSHHSNNPRSNDGDGTSQIGTTHDEYSSDKSSDDEGMYVSVKELPPLPVIHIPAVLKKALGYDEYLITKKKKLHRLPAEPTIISVLETFVHHYVTYGLRDYISKQTRRLKYEDLVPKVHLCKEVVDGLRIIFDFTVDNVLLYGNERSQFGEISNLSVQPPPRPSVSEFEREMRENEQIHSRTTPASDILPTLSSSVDNKASTAIGKRVLRSQHNQTNADPTEVIVTNCEKTIEKSESTTSLKKEEIQNSVPSSSCSSNGIAPPDNLLLDGTIIYSRHIEKLVHKELSNWKFIPDSLYFQKPLKPSLVYGATHLTRLLVKLPEILQYSHQRADAMETTVEFSEALLSFLTEHLEWFSDQHYVENLDMES